ncbi:GL15804 [Drosophila persimilis]|uniref:GL15804 n=1 Tax=Drosophila persimilis TaxID=7234 RepID=B4H0R2_DROPE|nr:GL15804 [Drosophila persimilis]
MDSYKTSLVAIGDYAGKVLAMVQEHSTTLEWGAAVIFLICILFVLMSRRGRNQKPMPRHRYNLRDTPARKARQSL